LDDLNLRHDRELEGLK